MTIRRNTSQLSARLRAVLAGFALLILAGCPNGGSGGLSGTYVAKNDEGSMTIEFKKDHKVHLTMQEAGGQPDASDGDYLIDGNKVTVQIPGGLPLMLVREGDELSASFMGQILRFKKD